MTLIFSEEHIVQLYNDMHFVSRNPICARYLQMTFIVSQQ
jgi:hypothetical protein